MHKPSLVLITAVFAFVTAAELNAAGPATLPSAEIISGVNLPPLSQLLRPQEVLVVANSRSGHSVGLARNYAKLRKIPDENILLLKTATGFAISRGGYNKNVLQPIRRHLIDKGLANRIRCIVLMWGVPVRVLGPAVGETAPHAQLYRTAGSKAHYGLAASYKLLSTVTRTFPKTVATRLKPIGDLFESPMPAPEQPLTAVPELQRRIDEMMILKQQDMRRIDDPQTQAVAARQLMALHLNIGGTRQLIRFLETEKPIGAPDILKLRQILEAAEFQLGQINQKPDLTEADVAKQLRLAQAAGGLLLTYSYAAERAGIPATKKKKSFTQRVLEDQSASVDNELALLWWSKYDLAYYIDNPLYWQTRRNAAPNSKTPPVLMTARLDGPTSADAMRMLNDSLATEAVGLKGKFYVDAGGGKGISAKIINAYDPYLKNLHAYISTETDIPAVLDENRRVFQPGSCPDAALYVGWYSLRKYVPAFTWNKGAVGWHVASWEATKLRDPNSEIWCNRMIQEGVAATVGAVREPTLRAFPPPQEFFPLLLTGRFTLAQCYWMTSPMVSWQMTLIGDPLYNPFAVNPKITLDKLPKGMIRK